MAKAKAKKKTPAKTKAKAVKKAATKKTTAKKAPAKKKAAAKKATKKAATPKKDSSFFEAIIVKGKNSKLLTFSDAGEFVKFLTDHLNAFSKGVAKENLLEISIPGELDKKVDAAIGKVVERLTVAYENAFGK